MAPLDSAIAHNRRAADAFKKTAAAVPMEIWNIPRAPGKWSPAQVTDHVGLSTKIARDAMLEKAGMGGIPKFLRPLAGRFFFQPVVKKGFPQTSKSPAIFSPAHDPMPREELLSRLEGEVVAMEADARAMAAAGRHRFMHPFFGRVELADYVTFNAHHLDHHCAQLPGAG